MMGYLFVVCADPFFNPNGVVRLAQGCGPTVRYPGNPHPLLIDFLRVTAPKVATSYGWKRLRCGSVLGAEAPRVIVAKLLNPGLMEQPRWG